MLCYSSWLPFLRCAALIMIASCSTNNSIDTENASRSGSWAGSKGKASKDFGEVSRSSGELELQMTTVHPQAALDAACLRCLYTHTVKPRLRTKVRAGVV